MRNSIVIGSMLICLLGDIDPYPNFDVSKILRPGFENCEELKTSDFVEEKLVNDG